MLYAHITNKYIKDMNKILTDLDFDGVLAEAKTNTQSGSELVTNYRSYLMNNPNSYALVNNFIKEARNCTFDNGVYHILEYLVDYLDTNKTLWALATACESIENSNNSRSYLDKNAARQVQPLLEMEEDQVVKYIKAGALKNVMFCESFRNIAKQVYKNQPIVEAAADYTITHPVSLVESTGDGVCFEIGGIIYKVGNDKSVQQVDASEVSNEFRNISRLLESNNTMIDEHAVTVRIGDAVYEISEVNECKKTFKGKTQTLTIDQLRENNRLILMSANPHRRQELAGMLESLAQLCENYDNVAYLDNSAIYTTNNDKFLVIESGESIYATLLASNRHPKWTINEGACDALAFIKSKTNVNLNESYTEAINSNLENVSEMEKIQIEEALKDQEMDSYRNRVEALTKKFKDDPVKLAVLSRIAQQLGEY